MWWTALLSAVGGEGGAASMLGGLAGKSGGDGEDKMARGSKALIESAQSMNARAQDSKERALAATANPLALPGPGGRAAPMDPPGEDEAAAQARESASAISGEGIGKAHGVQLGGGERSAALKVMDAVLSAEGYTPRGVPQADRYHEGEPLGKARELTGGRWSPKDMQAVSADSFRAQGPSSHGLRDVQDNDPRAGKTGMEISQEYDWQPRSLRKD